MKHVLLLLAITLFPLAAIHAQFAGSDDFSSNTSSWSTITGNSGSVAVTNGRLEYSTFTSPSANDSFTRTWIANNGSYDADWTLRIDVFLGTFSMPSNGFANVAMLVHNKSNPTNDFLRIELRRSGTGTRFFESDGFSNGTTLGAQFFSTGSTVGTLQFDYSAASHSLSAMYDPDGSANGYSFLTAVTYDISSGASNWGMTPSDQFQLTIVGQSGQTAVSSGDAYFDNFSAAPEPASGVLCFIGLAMFAIPHRTRSKAPH